MRGSTMRYLFIDTSSSYINIAIIEDDKILFNHHEKVDKDMSNKIIPIINSGFNQCNFDIKDINKIFIVNGPGSFTGVRIGVTVAKTIAWSLNTDVIPISSLEFLATTETDRKYLVPMIDARRGNVFAGIYDKELNNILPDQLISYKQLSEKLDDNYEQISYDFDEMKNPNCDILKVINKHLNDRTINPHLLKPNYLKLTEAEEKLNDQRNK